MAMTYDELLAKILETGATALQSSTLGGGWIYDVKTNALRAVVELHKPEHIIIKGFKTEYWCMADNNEPTPYPCPTILQIEKEIK
jgi:hypothetical protein